MTSDAAIPSPTPTLEQSPAPVTSNGNEEPVKDLPRILMVEDEFISRSILERYLKKEGYPIVSACNGKEALEAYIREPFPIVITDWLMPEMDGIALCRAIRNQVSDRYTFLILLTSQNSSEALVEGLEAGADDYIVKPVNPAELRVRLKGARRILDLEESLQHILAEIRELSIRDPLTGAFNRGYLDRQLEGEIQRAYRYQRSLSLIMCDLDHFKRLNDTYGHQAGDETLKRCVANIKESVRSNIDWVARYGGEEFLIVLPETDLAGCNVVAERMREKIASSPIGADGAEITVTASFGAATLLPDLETERVQSADLVKSADTFLYLAKQQGRNRVVAGYLPVNTENT